MAVPKSSLDTHLRTVRLIAEHREYEAEKQMLQDFTECYTDIREFLGVEYAKYAQNDTLTYDILQQKGEYARFLEEVINKYDGITKKAYKTISSLVNDTYELCYKGMVDAVTKNGRASELAAALKSIRAVTPDVIRRSVQNPIPKLRLSPVLQRHRKKVVDGIKREITIGLSQGDRMSIMAARITDKVKIGYKQSVLIARTEAHRVREGGFNDAADRIDNTLTTNNSQYRLVKVWKTMRDGRVRDTNRASHVDMQGQTVLQDEDFVMKQSGARAAAPGQSGVAAEDCNCRCYVSRSIMNDAEYVAATGKHFDGSTATPTPTPKPTPKPTAKPKKQVDNAKKSATMKVVSVADCKTVDDVETLLKSQKWFYSEVVNGVTYDSNDKLSLKGCDLDVAKGIYRSIEGIFTKYPQLKGKLASIEVRQLSSSTYAQCSVGFGRGGVTVNSRYFKEVAKVKASYERDLKAHFHPEGTTWESIVTHEFGHAIDDYLTNKLHLAGKVSRWKYKYVSAKMRPEVMRACGLKVNEAFGEVSGYATKNSMEWFAECFAEYIDSATPRRVAAEFGKQLDEIMKGVQ